MIRELEDYKLLNRHLKFYGGYARKKPGRYDTVIVKLGDYSRESFDWEYGDTGFTTIAIGGDIAKIELKK